MGLTDGARAYNTVWDEAKHHRGQPGNAGQFGPGGGAAAPAADPGAPADEAGDLPTPSVADEVQSLMDLDLRDPNAWADSDEFDRDAIDLAIEKGDEFRHVAVKPGDDIREQAAEMNALAAYRDKAYAGMNAYLRGQPKVTLDGMTFDTAAFAADAARVQRLVARAGALPEPFHVYRGIGYQTMAEVDAARAAFDAKVGQTFTLQGMVSTTYAPSFVKLFAVENRHYPLVFRIKARTGLAGFNESEYEVLQNHGTRYRVLGTSVAKARRNYEYDIHVVDVEEVLPGEAGTPAAPDTEAPRDAQAPASAPSSPAVAPRRGTPSRRPGAYGAAWDESKHPRATDGEFATVEGEDHGHAAAAVEEEPEHPRERFRKTPVGTKRGEYTKDRRGDREFWRHADGQTITDDQAWERFGGEERDVPDPEIEKLQVRDIEVDPERFQFKQKARSAAGTTDQFADVEKFDPLKAGVILAWRDREGRTWVVDGHHRVELAKRTGHPRMNAFVLEEAQGITHVQARATAALRNIATGHGEALDAAKAVRDMGWTLEDLKAEGISAKSAIVRDAMGLAALDAAVFSRVVDEEIPQAYAAEIGRQLADKPGKQIQAANAIGTAGNQAEVESIVRQIRAAPEVTTTQETLFGDETETRSLFAQRAKVEVALARRLKGDKALFRTLAEKAAKAETVEGNKINAEGSKKVAAGADELMLTLRSYGDKAGPVKEALDDAARRYGDGVPLAEAVSGALDALKAVDVWSGERRDDAPEPEERSGSLLDGLPDPEPDAPRDAVRAEDGPRSVREPERAPVAAAPPAGPADEAPGYVDPKRKANREAAVRKARAGKDLSDEELAHLAGSAGGMAWKEGGTKGKVGEHVALEALGSLGYTPAEARKHLAKVGPSDALESGAPLYNLRAVVDAANRGSDGRKTAPADEPLDRWSADRAADHLEDVLKARDDGTIDEKFTTADIRRAETEIRTRVEHYRRKIRDGTATAADRAAADAYDREGQDLALRWRERQAEEEADDAAHDAETAARATLPPRSADTMTDAIALSSPSGSMSKRARKAAQERLGLDLFGPEGLERPAAVQPSEPDALRRQAKELRDLADRGMKPRAHLVEAQRLEARADALEAKPKTARAPLRYDPATDRHNGERLTRGDVLVDEAGDRYRVDRVGGFMLTVDKLRPDGGLARTVSVSVDPTDRERYLPLWREGDGPVPLTPRQAAMADVRRAVFYAWDESKHPRGQPENAGEFGPGGGKGGTATLPPRRSTKDTPIDEALAESKERTRAMRERDAAAQAEARAKLQRERAGTPAAPAAAPPSPAAVHPAVALAQRFPESRDAHKGPDGQLTPERRALHQTIIAKHLEGKTPVPAGQARTFYVLGGGSGAGKTSIVKSGRVFFGDPASTVNVDADVIKAMLPEFSPLKNAGDPNAAGWVHEESSDLSKATMLAGFGGGHNVVLDGTGDSSIESLSKKLLAAKAKGLRVVGEYATCSVEEAMVRAEEREKKHPGRGKVAPHVIKHTHASVSLVLPQAIGRGLFDEARVWDTSGNDPSAPPRMIAEYRDGKLTIHDEGAWKRFQAKGEEDTGKG